MSRRRILSLASVLALVPLLYLLGAPLAARLGDWLLALHGHSGHQASVETEAAHDARAASGLTTREGWPETPAGRVASAWVDVFSMGDEAMANFLGGHLSEESLEKRSMEDRMASYRDLQHRLGSLILVSVVQSDPYELTAVLLAEDASRHRFVFTVREDAPHELLNVGVEQHGHAEHGTSR